MNNHSFAGSLNLRRSPYVLALLLLSLLASVLLADTLPVSVNVSQVLLGIPALLFCLQYAVHRITTSGPTAILLTAPLLRQAIFVLLPTVILEATGNAAIGSLNLDTLRDGATILTIENYVLFVVIAIMLPKRGVPVKMLNHLPKTLLFAAVFLMVVGFSIQLSNINVNSEAIEAPAGASLTQWWGPVGLALFMIWAVAARGKGYAVRISIVLLTTAAVSLPYLGTGGRIQLVQPLATAGIAYMICRPRQWSIRHLLISAGLAVLWFVMISAVTYRVRLDYYLSGQRASITDVRNSAFTVGLDYLITPVRRLGSMVLSAQYIHDTGMGPRTWANAAGLFLSSATSARILDLSAISGFDYRVQGLSPGAYLARQFGAEGGFSFPLSADLYLIGDYYGVVLGALIIGGLIGIWARLTTRVIRNSRIAAALVAGEAYMAIFTGETAEYAVGALMWKMAVLVLLFVAYEHVCRAWSARDDRLNKCKHGDAVLVSRWAMK